MSEQFSRNISFLGNTLFPFKSTKGFSMPKLAQLFNTTPPAIKRWINGILPRRPMMDNIANIVSLKFRLRIPVIASELINQDLETMIQERGGNLGAFNKDEMRKDESFGNRLRLIRERLDLSPEAFSKRLGISTEITLSFENGAIPDNRIIKKITKEFKISREWLLTGESQDKDGYFGMFPGALNEEDLEQILVNKEELSALKEIIENFDFFISSQEGVEFVRKLYEPHKKRNLVESLKFLLKAKKLAVKIPSSDMKNFIDIAISLSEK